MAAITTAASPIGTMFARSGTAQANTGQTDWLLVPSWATSAIVDYDLTSVGASTTPLVDVTVRAIDAVTLDDSQAYDLHAAFTQITAAAHLVIDIGPGVTGIADDTTTAATGASNAALNKSLPPILGIKILQDRTTGDEVYTYKLNVYFRR